MKTIKCCRCEQKRSPSRADGDFCQECFDHIEGVAKNRMELTRGVRCLLDTNPYLPVGSPLSFFLSIFHPDMPQRQHRAIIDNANRR